MNLKLIDTYAIPAVETGEYLTDSQLAEQAKRIRTYPYEVFYTRKQNMILKGITYAVIEAWSEV
jgi:hypothetical protein